MADDNDEEACSDFGAAEAAHVDEQAAAEVDFAYSEYAEQAAAEADNAYAGGAWVPCAPPACAVQASGHQQTLVVDAFAFTRQLAGASGRSAFTSSLA